MNSKLIKAVTICLILAAMSGCAKKVLVQPVIDPSEYTRMAVLSFETRGFAYTTGQQIADEIVIHLLRNAPDLEVIERTRIGDLIEEQDLEYQGYSTPESATTMGQLLDVDVILTGSAYLSLDVIHPADWHRDRVAMGVATVRLIDTRTGRVIWVGREDSHYSVTEWSEGDPDRWMTDHQMTQEVVSDLAEAIARNFYAHYERK
ncbi:MAG: CsgG/HfaB family protein [Candidatus Eisenbacteria bacterium]